MSGAVLFLQSRHKVTLPKVVIREPEAVTSWVAAFLADIYVTAG